MPSTHSPFFFRNFPFRPRTVLMHCHAPHLSPSHPPTGKCAKAPRTSAWPDRIRRRRIPQPTAKSMRKNLPTLYLLGAAAVFLSVVIASQTDAQQPGEIDLSFDPGSSIDGAVFACQQQSGGKWIIAGSFTTIHGTKRGRIARLNPDGSLDASFLDGLDGANGQVNAVAVQSDDKVLIGGEFWSVNGEERVRLARLNADGTLDHTFGEGLPGIVGHSLNLINSVHSIVLQSDGRILVGGSFTSVQGEPRNGIARLNADGTIDPTFGDGLAGVEAPHFPRVGTIVVQPNGKILLRGSFTSVNGEPRHDLARLHPDGTLDSSFDVELDGVRAIAVQDDERILVGYNRRRFIDCSSKRRSGSCGRRIHHCGWSDAESNCPLQIEWRRGSDLWKRIGRSKRASEYHPAAG